MQDMYRLMIEKATQANEVFIVMHNKPDADAISSAFVIRELLCKALNKKIFIVYSGDEIQREDLKQLQELLEIPVCQISEELEIRPGALLIYVDCIYGINSPNYKGEDFVVMCIDHHKHKDKFITPGMLIDPSYKSCTSLIYNSMREQIDNLKDRRVDTAIYFGLKRDTNNFEATLLNGDAFTKSIMEKGRIMEKVIALLDSSRVTMDELKTLSDLLSKIPGSIFKKEFSIVRLEDDMDQNLLGRMADMVQEVEGITVTVAMSYYKKEGRYRVSVRSTNKFYSAIDIINAIGEGGGHESKTGGWVDKGTSVRDQLEELMKQINCFNMEETHMSEMGRVGSYKRNKSIRFGYIDLEHYFDTGGYVNLNNIEVKVEGMVILRDKSHNLYPVSKEHFNKYYTSLNCKGEVLPTLTDNTGRVFFDFKECISSVHGESVVAVELCKDTRVITKFDKLRYVSGSKGDFLIINESRDVYTMKKEIFLELYSEDNNLKTHLSAV